MEKRGHEAHSREEDRDENHFPSSAEGESREKQALSGAGEGGEEDD
jgi:hypothetical protein